MALGLDPVGGSGDFPKVATGEYAFIVDEVHMVQFEGDETPKVRVFFNLGVRQTTKDEELEVRLTKYFKPSLFSGSSTYPTPAGWVLLCRAVGVDPKDGLADLSTVIGKAGVASVMRDEVGGVTKNKIEATMPLGKAKPPEGVELKGVTDKRNAPTYTRDAGDEPQGRELATAAGDPNW